jgi:pimeloyl-ACP methyl ester carboxylesterase
MQHFHSGDGTRLAYRDDGAGIPVLALAGLTRDGRDFDYLAPHLEGARLIRLDSRGRGGSQWTGAATYTVAQEASDVVALLDHLQLPAVAIIGSSRGGLLGMVMAATTRHRLTGLCLNDIGPVLERAGLERIGGYVGKAPSARTLREAAEQLRLTSPGFDDVPASRWAEEAVRRFTETADGLDLTYDPALRDAFLAAFHQPPVDLWPLFDACAGLPLALVRGANSDLMSAATARDMQARRPDMDYAEIPGRGHIPFLDEPEALACIRSWIKKLPAP